MPPLSTRNLTGRGPRTSAAMQRMRHNIFWETRLTATLPSTF